MGFTGFRVLGFIGFRVQGRVFFFLRASGSMMLAESVMTCVAVASCLAEHCLQRARRTYGSWTPSCAVAVLLSIDVVLPPSIEVITSVTSVAAYLVGTSFSEAHGVLLFS